MHWHVDLRQLEYFVRVAELGGFTRASIELNVAQPALSRHIRSLEVELRHTLLARDGRGAKVTESGKLLLEHARGILHQVELARDELNGARGSLSGRVSIGLPPSLSRLIVVPLIRALREQLPHAHLTLTEGFSMAIYEALRVGNLDMAVMYSPGRSADVEMYTLHKEELVLISARRSPGGRGRGRPRAGSIGLPEVATLPLILPSRPNVFRLLVEDEMMRIGLHPCVTLEVDGLSAILNLVKEALGHAVLPSYTVSNVDGRDCFEVRRIHSPRIMSELNLVWSARRPLTETHVRAREMIRQVVRDWMSSVCSAPTQPTGSKPPPP
jgi:LysR family nitrogen assimilation transcriptional regulator